ncbi:MAG: COX15/CtaA family protein, partial [Pseudomonadota bacterium]
LIVVVGVLFVWRLLRSGHARISAWGARIGVVLILQVVLGIVTVMHAAPLDLALLHQAMALVVVGALVHARFEIAYPSEQKITA